MRDRDIIDLINEIVRLRVQVKQLSSINERLVKYTKLKLKTKG